MALCIVNVGSVSVLGTCHGHRVKFAEIMDVEKHCVLQYSNLVNSQRIYDLPEELALVTANYINLILSLATYYFMTCKSLRIRC